MSVKTVIPTMHEGVCAACDADTQTFTLGQAYIAGLVLATVNGGMYVTFEVSNFCAKHRKQFDGQCAMLKEHHRKAGS